jgi:hypothetical protein
MGKKIKKESMIKGKFNLIAFLIWVGSGILAYFAIIFPKGIYKALWIYLTSLSVEDLGYIFLVIGITLGVLVWLTFGKSYCAIFLFGVIFCLILGLELSFPLWYNLIWGF